MNVDQERPESSRFVDAVVKEADGANRAVVFIVVPHSREMVKFRYDWISVGYLEHRTQATVIAHP